MKKGRTLRANEQPANDAMNVLMVQRRIHRWWLDQTDGTWTVVGTDGRLLLAGGSKADAKALAGQLGSGLDASHVAASLPEWNTGRADNRLERAKAASAVLAAQPVTRPLTEVQMLRARVAELEAQLVASAA
jgi:hypothetical protein